MAGWTLAASEIVILKQKLMRTSLQSVKKKALDF